MHDLRTLVAERSTMSIYISGESFELPQNMIGLLLEGFIKTQGTFELITAPAALFPTYGFRASEITGSFCHYASSYIVETRTRVILFEIGGFEGLQRRASSLISHGGAGVGDNPSPTREHSGLMSWPEGSFKSRRHLSEIGNNFSARAMQLSMYGSMVRSILLHLSNKAN